MLGGAEQHGGVAVMAAAVHLAVNGGAVVEVVVFGEVERIHVGAETNGAVGRAASEDSDEAGGGETGMDLDAARLEPLGDASGGADLLARGLGMTMDIAPERLQGFMARGDIGLDVHGLGHPCCWLAASLDEVGPAGETTIAEDAFGLLALLVKLSVAG